ncbi:MAG: 50S ribosomal protein L25/general stress protein Ctc [Gammaproteobacteria bacterium]|nr:50S ribosomal protein L25/general stress protein Ctc [Gammaproteobacteria bacterium]
MTDFVLNARTRTDLGKGASRRLRRLAEEVPAIVYGDGGEPEAITLSHRELARALESEAFYSHIISLRIDDKPRDVILKDVQRHPARPVILHADFLRVSKTHKLTTRVPLHFINEDRCEAVKQQGGVVQHNLVDLEIQCLPGDLPEYIAVDMSTVAIGQILHISDLVLPAGVESVALAHGADHDLPVVAIHRPKVKGDDSETPAEE